MDELQNIQNLIYAVSYVSIKQDWIWTAKERLDIPKWNFKLGRYTQVSLRRVVSVVRKDELLVMRNDIMSYIDDILADQNDINESTRAQLDAISTALAELQAKPSETKPRKPIGFIQPKDDDGKK